MLQVNQLIGFGPLGAGIPDALATFISVSSSLSNLTEYTFSVNLGAANEYDHFILAIGEDSVNVGVTLDAIPATFLIDGTSKLSIYVVPYTAGGTKDVVISYATSRTRCILVLYGVKNLQSMTPVDTLADDTDVANVLTDTVNVSAGGFVVAISNMNGSSSATGVGVTERTDAVYESNVTIWSGEANYATAQVAMAVTVTWASAPQDLIGVSMR